MDPKVEAEEEEEEEEEKDLKMKTHLNNKLQLNKLNNNKLESVLYEILFALLCSL